MAVKKSIWKYTYWAYLTPVATAVVFIILNAVRSNSASSPFLLRISILIPEVIIWLIAAVCAVHLKQYAISIEKSPDSEGLNYIANALLWLTAYIIVLTTAGTAVNLLIDSSLLSLANAIRNHLPIVIALISVMYLWKGSHKLLALTPRKQTRIPRLHMLMPLYFLLAALFAWNFYRVVPTLEPVNGIARFNLPVELLLFTYLLPHIVLWYRGLQSCLNIAQYAETVKGNVYKSLFRKLYIGILVVFVCIFLAQVLIISTITVSGIGLGLGLVYFIIMLCAVGYVMIYRGVETLCKIEK